MTVWRLFSLRDGPHVNARALLLYSRIVRQKLKPILENEPGVRSPDGNKVAFRAVFQLRGFTQAHRT